MAINSKASIRVYKMGVGDGYPTPWCGWATWTDNKGVVRGVNCEARTEKEALENIKLKVANEVSANR